MTPTINKFNYIDYDKPTAIPITTDMRTAYNRGHQNIIQNDKLYPQITGHRICDNGQKRREDYLTEQANQYSWKLPQSHSLKANLPMSCHKVNYEQTLQEKLAINPPIAIKSHSTYATDYYRQTAEPYHGPQPMDYHCAAPMRPTNDIYTHQHGYYKYLDPYATTNMIDFGLHTSDKQNGIGRKDCITVWDWLETPKSNWGYGLKEHPFKEKTIQYNPIVSIADDSPMSTDPIVSDFKAKFVPNTGITSEKQTKYTIPEPIKFNIDVKQLNWPTVTLTQSTPTAPESKMYGSGKRIDEFIKQD